MSYHFDSNDRDDSGLECCPFCKSKDIFLWFSPDGEAEYYTHKGKVSRTPVLYVVKCNQCGARTANFADLNDALKAWNRRGGGQDDV